MKLIVPGWAHDILRVEMNPREYERIIDKRGESPTVYVFAWGNNERRAQLKRRRCVVEAHGRMNTVLVRFLDTGEKVTTSRRALRPE